MLMICDTLAGDREGNSDCSFATNNQENKRAIVALMRLGFKYAEVIAMPWLKLRSGLSGSATSQKNR